MPEPFETGLSRFGKEYRMAISTGANLDTSMISISKRQWAFLRSFLNTGNLREAIEAAGVKKSDVVNWYKNPKFRNFLKERYQYAADRNGCTFDWSVSQLKGLWDGKVSKNKVQLDSLKEINRMLGHIKEFQGGINAREFINAEYVVIQKGNPVGAGPEPAQIPNNYRAMPSEICLPDVRTAIRKDDVVGAENDPINNQTKFLGLVSDQPTQAGQGYGLAETSGNPESF